MGRGQVEFWQKVGWTIVWTIIFISAAFTIHILAKFIIGLL